MLCYACFREKEAEGPCPFCGYDPAGTARKFPLALRPGTILNGRYIVGRVLGQGGFGITYLALDDRTRARFAMKEYFPSEFAGRAYGGSAVQVHSENQRESLLYGKAQFLEEARTLAAVSGSENIVRIYSYFEENGTAYFAMEYVEGVSLDAYLRQKGGRLTAPEAEKLFLPLMGALEALLAKALPEMFLEHTDLYRKEPEYMGVESLAESGMTLRFTIPVKEVNIFRARRQFNRDLRILFAENGVEIPFPQVDVHQR